MGIYIHGMGMPKKGESGRIAILLGSDGIADVYNFCGTRLGKYICECSVIELPPHGRLIEDVAVREQIDEWLDSVGDVVVGRSLSYYGELLGCIEDAPTIIPADPEEGGSG